MKSSFGIPPSRRTHGFIGNKSSLSRIFAQLQTKQLKLSEWVVYCYVFYQHSALSVISEEKVLDAIMMWGANKDDIHGWEDANQRAMAEGAELFQDRLEDVKLLIPLVRFPLMSLPVLQMVSQRSIYSFVWGDGLFYYLRDLSSTFSQACSVFLGGERAWDWLSYLDLARFNFFVQFNNPSSGADRLTVVFHSCKSQSSAD